MYEEKFTKWMKWEDRNSLDQIDLPGIYVCAITDYDLSDVKFSWINEIEYIGMTNSTSGLKGRLRQFNDTLHRKIRHGGADRMLYTYQHVEIPSLLEKLFVSVAPFDCSVTSNKPIDLMVMGDITKFEYTCFAEYVSIYGQLPKFNDKKNTKKYSLTTKSKNKESF